MLKKVPHTYVIVFFIIILAAILTWFIPPGKYVAETTEVNGEQQTTLTFYYKDSLPAGRTLDSQVQTWQVLSALFKGFVRQSNIIVFILMIGGAFWIMNQTRAIDVGIMAFLKTTRKLEHNRFLKWIGIDNIIIVMVMVLFSSFGAIFGMSEETIAFVIILIPLAISMGYDSITGVCMVYIAAHLGFAGAILNPFTIGIAQGLADIPLFSGIEYRLFAWLMINLVGIAFVLRYVARIRKNPKASLMYEEDSYWRQREEGVTEKIDYYTPTMAWIVWGAVLVVLTSFLSCIR
jgi:uncharacterized ion transporter superfamily protein YfcC